MVDHKLMESLEYKGDYGRRFMCRDCASLKNGECEMYRQHGINVSERNNICRNFAARIKNPSAPEFNFDDYLEFLMSDFYRPYNIDKDIVVGKQWCMQSLQMTKTGGWEGKWGYSPLYKTYDQPYCRLVNPLTVIRYGKYNFTVDYRLFRNGELVKDNKIKYITCYWKEKETSRKNQVLHSGEFELLFKDRNDEYLEYGGLIEINSEGVVEGECEVTNKR